MDLRMIKTKLVTVQDMINIQDLDEYYLPERVWKSYASLTRDNDFITYEDCKRKLIRNIILGYEAPPKKGLEHKIVMYYGCLAIHLNLIEHSIAYVNISEVAHKCYINKEKRKMLNYIMGIEDDKCYIK